MRGREEGIDGEEEGRNREEEEEEASRKEGNGKRQLERKEVHLVLSVGIALLCLLSQLLDFLLTAHTHINISSASPN